MPRIKTKTSSFGTSKREGHDATQFYSSNLYNGLEFDEKQEIIDHSDAIPPVLFLDPIAFTPDALKGIPEYSIHLIILDLTEALRKYNPPHDNAKEINPLLKELYRILITGGKIALIIDDTNKSCSSMQFYPYHAFLSMEMIALGFLMRGEVIWRNINEKKSSISSPDTKITNLQPLYQRIMIYSKQVMKRTKGTNADTITRDQFLQYTKSIWKSQPELINNVPLEKPVKSELCEQFDCYNHLMQLYSFEADKILILHPPNVVPLIPAFKQIRKSMITGSCLDFFLFK